MLQRIVGATLGPVDAVQGAAALAAAVDTAAIAIIDADLARASPELRDRPARGWIVVAGAGATPADAATIDALLAAGWRHVIAHPMPVLAEELLATVQKLRRCEVFGLEKYVAWGAEVASHTLEDARERDAVVATLARDVVAVGLPERVGSLVSVIADELIANALYLAPLDEHNQRYRAGEARERGRALRGRDVVTVRWATDAHKLAIEVRDRWGTLEPASVSRRLASGAASPGGMGLALTYACCNQLVIDLQPDVMTEVIALLDVRHPPGELARSASFHTFVIDAPAPS